MQTHNHIEAVIFDWAGTTVDYGCFAPVQVFTEVFTNAGVAPTPQEVREPMGMLKWDHIRTMLEMPRIKREWIRLYGQAPTDTDADKLYASYEPALLHILTRYADPKPYVVETIEKLRALGIKIGSTTGYTDIMMEIVAPQAAKAGDTVADILEGKNAGVFTIGILDRSSVIGLSEAEFEALSEDEKNALRKHAEQKYLDAGADAVVQDIRGILEYL